MPFNNNTIISCHNSYCFISPTFALVVKDGYNFPKSFQSPNQVSCSFSQ